MWRPADWGLGGRRIDALTLPRTGGIVFPLMQDLGPRQLAIGINGQTCYFAGSGDDEEVYGQC